MKKFLIIFLLTPQMAFGQSTYIKVNVNENIKKNGDPLWLENIGYGVIDSKNLYDYKFIFKVPESLYPCYQLRFGNRRSNVFFIEKGAEVEIDIDLESNVWYNNSLQSSIKGGQYNEIYQTFIDTLNNIELLKYRSTTDLQENINDNLIYENYHNLIKESPFVGVMTLFDTKERLRHIDPIPENIRRYIALMEQTGSNLIKHLVYDEIMKSLDSLKRLAPEGTIYDFSLITQKKEYISTFDKRGKFLLILFSSRGCLDAEEVENKLLKSYNELKSLNFEVLRVSLDFCQFTYDPRILQNINGLYNYYPWQNVYLFNDEKGNKVRRNYNVNSWPRSFLYSPSGVLLEKNPSVEAIFNQLKLFKE